MAVISCYKAKSKDDIHEELIEDFNIYNDIEEVINNLHNLKQINKHLEVIGLFKELLSDQKQLRQEKELDEKIENITSGIYQDLSDIEKNINDVINDVIKIENLGNELDMLEKKLLLNLLKN
uniref:Uncharacterized protein n=1 Tax=Spiroplasma citri TaxID=2133 RepID=Q14MC0_SPICI|nr:hypothetical protein SPICI11_002 [Spiroplasma citri]